MKSFFRWATLLTSPVIAFEGCPIVDIDWEELAVQIFNGRNMFSAEGGEMHRNIISHMLVTRPERPFDCIEAIAASLLSYSQNLAFSGHAAIPLAALRLGYSFVSAQGNFPNCTAWPLQERDYHDATIRLDRRRLGSSAPCSQPEMTSHKTLVVSRCADLAIKSQHQRYAEANGLSFMHQMDLAEIVTPDVEDLISNDQIDWFQILDCGAVVSADTTKYREPCLDYDVMFGEDAGGLSPSIVWFRLSMKSMEWLQQWAIAEQFLPHLGVSPSLTLQYTLLINHVWKSHPASPLRWPEGVESVDWIEPSDITAEDRFNLTSIPVGLHGRLQSVI